MPGGQNLEQRIRLAILIVLGDMNHRDREYPRQLVEARVFEFVGDLRRRRKKILVEGVEKRHFVECSVLRASS